MWSIINSVTLPCCPARSQDYKTLWISPLRPQVPEILIVLTDVNSTVCSDHDYVRVRTHVGHGGRVKDDEDVEKEQKVEMENSIKIWIYLEPEVGMKSFMAFWKAESKQNNLALTLWQHWLSFFYAVQSELINLEHYISGCLAEQPVLHQPMPWLEEGEL